MAYDQAPEWETLQVEVEANGDDGGGSSAGGGEGAGGSMQMDEAQELQALARIALVGQPLEQALDYGVIVRK
jgi:hypothetical protein